MLVARMAAIQKLSVRALRAPIRPFARVQLAQAAGQLHPRIPRRHASTSTDGQTVARLRTLLFATTIVGSGYLIYLYTTDTRASVHRWIVPPLLRLIYPDAEEGHNAAVSSMKMLYSINLHPRERSSTDYEDGKTPIGVTVFGQILSNPVGISAGLDKHADIPDALFALGASVVEVGGCTPLAQPGNPRPRMFRIPGLDGLINRYGLNSHGADKMAMRLHQRVRAYARSVGLHDEQVLNGEGNVPPGSLMPNRLLAVQIAKNKDTPEQDVAAVSRDYTYCVSRLAPYADILVVNVSSPNTPGLRDLQAVEPLTKLLTAVVEEAKRTNRKTTPKVMVKVSPDEEEDAQMDGIVQAVWKSGVDGVIVGNTTKQRFGIVPPGVVITPNEAQTLSETGGYSGPMMFERTLSLVSRYRKKLDRFNQRPVSSQADKNAADEEAVSASLDGIDGATPGILTNPPQLLSRVDEEPQDAGPKVIFATGGVTNGEQALRLLNAGASVAMVYTSLVYGGAGTITRIKSEIKDGITTKET